MCCNYINPKCLQSYTLAQQSFFFWGGGRSGGASEFGLPYTNPPHSIQHQRKKSHLCIKAFTLQKSFT
jgi:hypothetical protein